MAQRDRVDLDAEKSGMRHGGSIEEKELVSRYGFYVSEGGNRVEGTQLNPTKEVYEEYLLHEIAAHLDQNSARLDQLVRIRDTEEVSAEARALHLPGEFEDRVAHDRRLHRRAVLAWSARLTVAVVVFLAVVAGIVAGAILVPLPVELKTVLSILLVAAYVLAAVIFVRSKPGEPRYAPATRYSPEALMMQRFLDIRSAIIATESWGSDTLGGFDLDVEHGDIAEQLRQMEDLSRWIGRIDAEDDQLLLDAIESEQTRLDVVRMSLVDRLAALDRYRVSLEQVDTDAAREAKFREVENIRSGLDSLETGRVSSEFSIEQHTLASEQLDRSMKISRQLLEELRGAR